VDIDKISDPVCLCCIFIFSINFVVYITCKSNSLKQNMKISTLIVVWELPSLVKRLKYMLAIVIFVTYICVCFHNFIIKEINCLSLINIAILFLLKLELEKESLLPLLSLFLIKSNKCYCITLKKSAKDSFRRLSSQLCLHHKQHQSYATPLNIIKASDLNK